MMISSQETRREVLEQIKSDANNAVPPDGLDSVLADAMNALSVNDREKVLHEIHGITEEINETDEFVNRKMDELQFEIAMILETGGEVGVGYPNLPTAAYELAVSISPQYVSNRKFRLQFLRADDYNARLAAERLMHHFDLKFQLWDGNKLCQDITSDDLDEDDLHTLRNGSIQTCPVRDRAGRAICCVFPLKERFKPDSDKAKCMGRMAWYTHTAANDENAEKKGIVFVVFAVGELNLDKLYHEVEPMIQKVRRALPAKIVSMHFCFSNPLFRHIIENVLFLFHRELWAGGKIHQGSQQEVFYALMSYGIPTDALPVAFNNDIKRKTHSDQLNMMQKKEEYIKKHGKEAGEKCVIIPYLKDVLLGKGVPNQSSPGSMRLKMIVDELLPKYDSLGKTQKVELAQQVVDMLRKEGGRFLSKDTGVWMIVHDNIARSRVATMFRNRRKVQLKKQKTEAARKEQEEKEEIRNFASKNPRLDEDLEGILADAALELDDGLFTKRTRVDDSSPLSIFQW